MRIERRLWRDLDELAARLRADFRGISGVALPRSADRYRYTQIRLTLGDVSLTRHEHLGFRFSAWHADTLHLAIPLRGGTRVKSRNRDTCTSPFVLGGTLPPNDAFAVNALPGVSYTVNIPISVLARQIEALGEDAEVGGTIAPTVDLQSGPGVALVRNVLTIFNELQTLSSAGLSGLVVASFSEALLNLTLAAALPKLRAKLCETPVQIASGTAERTRQYLIAYAHEPIRIADLAAEMGVGIRALQAAFRRHVGCSPREYLFKCRLDLARARLLSALPTDTVSSIAIDCGFLNLGLFASRYRRTFGELPSQTLARNREPGLVTRC